MNRMMETLAPLVGRIFIGGYFVWLGMSQLLNLPNTTVFFARLSVPAPVAFAVTIASIELLAGLALVVGLGTRLAAAFLLIYISLVSVIFFNSTITELYIANVAIVGGLLYVVTFGSGSFAVTNLRRTSRAKAKHP